MAAVVLVAARAATLGVDSLRPRLFWYNLCQGLTHGHASSTGEL